MKAGHEFDEAIKKMKDLSKKFEKSEKKTYGDYRPKLDGKPGDGYTVVCVVAMI